MSGNCPLEKGKAQKQGFIPGADYINSGLNRRGFIRGILDSLIKWRGFAFASALLQERLLGIVLEFIMDGLIYFLKFAIE